MSKKLIGYLLFFAALVLVFYYFLFRGTDRWKVKLPVISYVKPFHFTTQDGFMFTDRDMLGKVCVVEYFFTTCKGICPKMNTSMKGIYAEFKNEPNFMIGNRFCAAVKKICRFDADRFTKMGFVNRPERQFVPIGAQCLFIR
jgi:protein SCO1/2